MIEQNNIKDFAIAAFRHYHNTRKTDITDAETAAVLKLRSLFDAKKRG